MLPLGGQLFTELGNTFLFSLPDVEIFLGFLTAAEGVSAGEKRLLLESVFSASGGRKLRNISSSSSFSFSEE